MTVKEHYPELFGKKVFKTAKPYFVVSHTVYWIEEVHSDVTKWWHWKKPRFKSEYYLVNEFTRFGPFENEEIIYRYSGMAGMIIGVKPLAMVANAFPQT